jgi:hypothetical protein
MRAVRDPLPPGCARLGLIAGRPRRTAEEPRIPRFPVPPTLLARPGIGCHRPIGSHTHAPLHPFEPGFPELKAGGPACAGLRGLEMDMPADWGTGAWLKGTPGPEIIPALTPGQVAPGVPSGRPRGCTIARRPSEEVA